ncbi:hypothetical protein [Bacterioplanoides sp.]
MTTSAVAEPITAKSDSIRPVHKPRVNTGYYEMLAQLALTNKRRQRAA